MSTPSHSIVAEAAGTFTVVDSLGRTIECRRPTAPPPHRPTALDRFRLFRAIGPMASNQHYLGMAMLAVCATSIDGVPLPFPTTEAALDAAIHRLGNEGTDALAPALDRQAPAHPDHSPGN